MKWLGLFGSRKLSPIAFFDVVHYLVFKDAHKVSQVRAEAGNAAAGLSRTAIAGDHLLFCVIPPPAGEVPPPLVVSDLHGYLQRHIGHWHCLPAAFQVHRNCACRRLPLDLALPGLHVGAEAAH